MPLSDVQARAAHRLDQDVCVVAGPGSGKTSVLIERFSWLVRSQKVNPARILAITFTEKAATEIRQRLVQAFREDRAVRQQIERAWVSTIHAFCARLLRENAIEAGVDPSFTILEQPWSAMRQVADDVLEQTYQQRPERMRSFLQSLAVATERDGFVPDLASSLIEIYQAIRLAGASFDEVRTAPSDGAAKRERLLQLVQEIAADRVVAQTENQKRQHGVISDWIQSVLSLPAGRATEDHIRIVCEPDWNKNHLVRGSAARELETERRQLCKGLLSDFLLEYYADERAMVGEALQRIDQEYRSRKQSRSQLDFDDLEEATIHLLERDANLRERIQAGFDYILMDELQDTNPLQWRLMELVRRRDNFFAVGDVNQSIYGFRHARPELFDTFRKTLEASGRTVDVLRDNYRTRPEVLEQLNHLFAEAPGVESHRLMAGRQFPSKTSESVELICVFGDNSADTERREALWVAKRITELVNSLSIGDRKAKYGDIAILTRANYSTAGLQHALDEFGIPSVVVGGLTFFDTREVRDLKLLLDVLVNPRNEIALAGLLRSPLFGLSDEDLFHAAIRCGSLISYIEESPPAAWRTIEELRRLRNQVSPDRLLRRVLDECDYGSGLTDRGRSNVNKFLAMLRDRYAKDPVPLSELVEALEQAAPDSEAPPAAYGDAVRLMTMHKAKGLEFPVVFLPFLHKGRSYGFPVISYSHEHGLGIKWRNPVTGDGCGDTIWSANRAAAQAAQDGEENRLLYVGCTRSQEHLILSWSSTGNERGFWSGLIARRFGVDVAAPSNTEARNGGVRIVTTEQAPPVLHARAGASRSAEISIVSRLESQNSADSAISVTDVSRFVECPRKYYLGRYLGQRSAGPRALLQPGDEEPLWSDEDIGAGELGSQVHAILAGQPETEATGEAKDLARSFLSSSLHQRAMRAARTEREWDFVFNVAGMAVRGQIDLWFEDKRGLVIVDYKTDRKPDLLTMEAHATQLRIYSLALERSVNREADQAILYFLRSQSEHHIDVTPLSLGLAVDVVHRLRAAMESRSFPLYTGDHCKRCEFFRQQCPAGS